MTASQLTAERDLYREDARTMRYLWVCAEWYAENIMAQVDDMATRAEIRRMADAAVNESVRDVVNKRLAWLEEYLPKIQAENEKLRNENNQLRGYRASLRIGA